MAEMDESSETETDIFEPIDFSKLVPSKLQSYILKQPLKVTKLISQVKFFLFLSYFAFVHLSYLFFCLPIT